jgi:endonuclease YncB( thermonuclease family)
MKKMRAVLPVCSALILLAAVLPTLVVAKAMFGEITEVRSADIVVLAVDNESYVVHLVGVGAATEGPIAQQAKEFVTRLVLGKRVSMRLASRAPNGELYGQLMSQDATGIHDVGLELVRSGLARRLPGEDFQFGYKYGELSRAERDAQASRRGLWATSPR